VRLGLIALGAVVLGGCDRPMGVGTGLALASTPASQAASDFTALTAGDDLFETQTSQIAAVRATHPAVRAFARRMAVEHGASAGPAGMSDHLQALVDGLNHGTAADFDKTYMEQQIQAQQDALRRGAAFARRSGDPAASKAATELGRAIQDRLDQARAIQDALNKRL
jgi:putative membrane protein